VAARALGMSGCARESTPTSDRVCRSSSDERPAPAFRREGLSRTEDPTPCLRSMSRVGEVGQMPSHGDP